jgi:hypothetical protein
MSFMEREYITKVASNRMHLNATIASGLMRQETLTAAYDTYESYTHLALPYLFGKDKMGKVDITKENIDHWKRIIAAKKTNMSSMNKKED